MVNNFVSDTEKFTLDSVSSDTLGLFVDYLAPVPLAEQRYTDFNTGADEQGTTPDDVFNNIQYQIRFYTFLPDDYNDTAIKAFCYGKSVLTLSRFPDYYFKIKKTSLQAADGSGYGKRIDYILTLTLAPFRYTVDNEQITLASGDSIVNSHTRYSKPEFEITGTGDITLTLNGAEFSVKGLEANQTIIIDSTRHVTYSGDTLLIGKTEGKYPLLDVGSNTVSWTGSISSIKYKGNWRDY
jgi:phage-related protein